MIFILGGTSEAHVLGDYLLEKKIPFMISVATEYGKNTFKNYGSRLVFEKLDKERMRVVFKEHEIDLILDLTHPYAATVSQNAIEISKEQDIQYIRYERSTYTSSQYSGVYYVSSHQGALVLAKQLGKRLFLAIGSNYAGVYAHSKEFEKVYLRLLPKSQLLKKCEDMGFPSECLIAMQGPFSTELNKAMLIATQSDVMITKESGKAGGFQEKLAACQELSIPLIVVARPEIEYPHKFEDMDALIDFINSNTR